MARKAAAAEQAPAVCAEVVLFTAGLEDYAKPILDRLHQRYTCFHARLYRPATSASRSYPCIKVLAVLAVPLQATFVAF